MSIFAIRSRRIPLVLAVEMFLQSKKFGGVLSSESSPGILKSVSKKGASIICNKMMLDGKHIFFNTQPGTDTYLLITGLPEDFPVGSVLATTVWMDSCIYEERPSFKLGVQFLQEEKELFTYLKHHHS